MEFWCSDEIDAGGGRETGNLFGVAYSRILYHLGYYTIYGTMNVK